MWGVKSSLLSDTAVVPTRIQSGLRQDIAEELESEEIAHAFYSTCGLNQRYSKTSRPLCILGRIVRYVRVNCLRFPYSKRYRNGGQLPQKSPRRLVYPNIQELSQTCTSGINIGAQDRFGQQLPHFPSIASPWLMDLASYDRSNLQQEI
ncbi:hypothetical protein AVEN_266372-1 [Araneus ventricosus]|uniref:Uncharacterized protein n=1 Tax=Araneus ventricosus TaxID=182803 RepID=A0A4Y2CR93_ARAVE|nr:hypothetical protein AVEN_266372-1 [Araneus ventricosus]